MNHSSSTRASGFTMMELFAVILLISIMIMLLLPAVQSAREMARRTSCANNLLQVSLGMTLYHGTYEQLPVHLSGTDGSPQPAMDNDRRLSALVAILPFVGHPELAAKIAGPLPYSTNVADDAYFDLGASDPESESIAETPDETVDQAWPPGGPEPFQRGYRPWRVAEMDPYRCPSDPGIGGAAIGRVNYAVCLGDGMVAADSGPMKSVGGTFVIDEDLRRQTLAAMRGPLVPRMITRLSDITDGLAHTILLGEIATDLGDQDIRTRPVPASTAEQLRDQPDWARRNELIDTDRPGYWLHSSNPSLLDTNQGARRGFRWADGMPIYTTINTILPPNREIVLAADRDDTWGVLPPSSRHQGGAHVAMADGMIQFITDSIDAGNESIPSVHLGSPTAPGSPSPYGLWGAMGTRNSGELITVPPAE